MRADELVRMLRVPREIGAPAVRADEWGGVQRGRGRTIFHPCSIRDAVVVE